MLSRSNQRPALASTQFHNAVDMSGIDPVALPDQAMEAFAMPATIRPDVEYLLHVAALEDLSLKRPGVIVRIRMGFLEPEAVQHPTIIEMVFGERPRHAFDPNDCCTSRDMASCRTRYPQRHTNPSAVAVARFVPRPPSWGIGKHRYTVPREMPSCRAMCVGFTPSAANLRTTSGSIRTLPPL